MAGFGDMLKGAQGMFTNPLFTAGASIYSGAPIGQSMQQAQRSQMMADQQREQAEQKAAWQKFAQSDQVPGGMKPFLPFVSPQAGASAMMNHSMNAPARAQSQENTSLQMELTKARIKKYMSGGGDGTNRTQWGKTGPVFEMNGRTYTVQFADDGSRKVLPLDPGMVPASHSPTLAVNKQEALGDAKSRADASAKLPTMELKAKQLIGYMDAVVNHPGYGVGTSIVGSRLPSYSETAQDFDERVGQIQGQTFMLAFQDLKGAGPITDSEGAKATAAYGRVANTKVGSENYKRAVADLKKEVLALVDVVRNKASGGAPQPNVDQSNNNNDPLGIR